MKKRILAVSLIMVIMAVSVHGIALADQDTADEDLFAEMEIERGTPVPDPLFWFNYGMYRFNDKLYYWALKPVATGYRAVLPEPVRTGIAHFFYNLMFPVRFINSFLQGKFKSAGTELDSFIINTTLGGLGFMNPARDTYALASSEEDLGQTLGAYGIGEGFYLVLPILGPFTFRDTLGRIGDYFLTPTSYMEPLEASIGIQALDRINSTSFRIGDYETLKASAIDHYVAMQSAYIQYRRLKISE